jgi:Peptidase family M23
MARIHTKLNVNKRRVAILGLVASTAATAILAQPPGRSASLDNGDASRPDACPAAEEIAHLTPLVMRKANRPVPVMGSDHRYHLVYELYLENFSGERVRADDVQVLTVTDGSALAHLDTAAIASRLVVRDQQRTAGEFAASQLGILYLHVSVDAHDLPRAVEHRIAMTSKQQAFSATAGCVSVAQPTQLLLDAPLRGRHFIAGDGCCDSIRHLRATLSLNGSAYTAQRFAIDWEQLDSKDRIYLGNAKDPKSYAIYAKPAYAVADGRVVAAVDGMPDSPIGSLPGLAPDKADGNHVVLDLGGGHFALYAHFKPHSVQVAAGQSVRRGQLLGLVGTSGNSSEPHLHFQITDGPSPLMSDGLPYLLREFNATRRGVSTAAFDAAASDGTPIKTVPLSGPVAHRREMPLDLWIADFPE